MLLGLRVYLGQPLRWRLPVLVAAAAMAGDLSREALDLDGVLSDLREAGRKTVVVGLDDGTGGQVYVYVGTKTRSSDPITAAGLVIIRGYDGVFAYHSKDGVGPTGKPVKAGDIAWFSPSAYQTPPGREKSSDGGV